MAYKNLDEEYFQDWIKRHHEASTALEGREDKLSEIYEEIEKDLMVGISQNLGQALREAAEIVICEQTAQCDSSKHCAANSSVGCVTGVV